MAGTDDYSEDPTGNEQQPIRRSIGASPIVPSAPADLPAEDTAPEEDFQPTVVAKPTRAKAAPALPSLIGPKAVGNLQKYQGALERFNAGEMWNAQQDERVKVNADSQAALKASRVQTQRNPETGLTEPVTDAEGNVQFRPGKGPVRYDENGRAVQTQTDANGPKEVALDAKAEIGTHPDTPNQLYRQNKHSPWEPLGSVQEGLASTDPAVKKAALDAQLGVDQDLHKAAHDALGKDIYDSALKVKQLQTEAIGKQATLKTLRSQADELGEKAKATEGGLFGIGQHPTPEAAAAKTKLDEVNGKIDELQGAGYGKLTGKGTLAEPPEVTDAKKAHHALTADRAAWSQAKPNSLGQLDEVLSARRAQIEANGGDPEQDRVISAIEARKKELGIGPANNANEDELRKDPTFGPLFAERDALWAEHTKAGDALNQLQGSYEQRLAPIRDEIAQGQARLEPLQNQAAVLQDRLEKLVGMAPAAEGEDPEVRRDEVTRRIAQLSDSAAKARVQTVLNALNPAIEQLSQGQAQLQPILDAHDQLQAEGQQKLSDAQDAMEADLGPRREALNAKFEEAGNAREQANWKAISGPVLEEATKRALAEKEISKDWSSGNEPDGLYHQTGDGKITFERGYTAPAMIRAFHDGALSPDWMREHLADARKADEDYRQIMAAAGSNPKLKAFVDSGIKSYLAFQGGTAASAAVAPFDPELAAAGAPVGGWGAIALPALVHGIAFLGGTLITKKASDALLKKASDYNDLVNSLEKSAQLEPGYASAGEIAGMGPAAVSSISGFLKAGKFVAEKEGTSAAVKFVATKLASGAGAGAVFEAALRPAFDAATHLTGLDDSEFHFPTFKSVAQAAFIMSVLSGEGLGATFKRAADMSRNAAPETADLVKESIAQAKKKGITPEFRAFFGGIDPEVAGTTHEKVAAFAQSLGMEYRPAAKPDGAADTAATTEAGNRGAEAAPTLAPETILSEPKGGGQEVSGAAATVGAPAAPVRAKGWQVTPTAVEGTAPKSGSVETVTNQPGKKTGEISQPTFAVEVQNAKGETQTIQVQAANEKAAHAQVAKTIPAGRGLIRDVTRIAAGTAATTEAAAAAPTNFVEHAVSQVREQVGRDLKPEEDTHVRKLAGIIAPHYERWQKAFDAVNVTLQANKTAGAAYSGEGNKLVVSLPDLARHISLYKADAKSGAALMTHEAAHAITVTSGADVEGIWRSAPKDLQAAVKSFYHTANPTDYTFGHELWAYMLAGKIELAAGRKVKVNGRFLPEQSSRKFLFANRKALAVILRYVRDTEGELRKAGVSEDTISTWKSAEKLFLAKAREVDGHGAGAYVEGSNGEEGKSKVSAGGPSARGPPAVESGGSAGAAESATAPAADGRGRGADEIAPKTAPGAVEPSVRAKLTTALKLPDKSIGHASKVSQNGRTVNVAFVAQEASAARTSHDIHGRSTPGYDQALQPRDRSLPQYRKQSQNIATGLDFPKSAFFPETKTPATTADLGAPVMTKAGDTLIGNGREIGIKAAYDQGLTSARKYKADFVRNAKAFGIDPATVMAMKAPVLKRVVLDDLSKDELVRFSQDSNQGAAMSSNEIEVAAQDATKLTPELLSNFDPNYDLAATKNQGFLRAYSQSVIRGGAANESNVTKAEMIRRVRMAIFTYAYGTGAEGRAALDRLAGEQDDAGKTITNGLLTVAPIVARMRNDIGTGDLHSLDIAPALTRAAQDIVTALDDRPKNQSAKVALDGLLGQGRLFEDTDIERRVLDFLVRNRGNRTAIEEALSNYVESVYRIGSPKEGQLFGETKVPTTAELWDKATTPEALAPKTEERALAAQALNRELKSQPIQTFRTADDAFAAAEKVKPSFDRQLEEIARATGAEVVSAPIKSRERASAKVAADYDGDWSQIKDLVRATLVVRNLRQAKAVVGTLSARFGATPKRDFTQPLATGYRDALINPIIDGHATEIQVHLEPVVAAKGVAHPFYEKQQSIERKAKTENRQLSAQETRTVERLTLAQQRIYAAAFAGHIDSGISSTASEGLQGRAPSDLASSSVIGRGTEPVLPSSPSKAQALPSLSTTIPQAPSGLAGSETSMKPLAPGKALIASSSVISPALTAQGGIGQRLSAQQLDLFGEAAPAAKAYVKTLPAAAKVSRPALKAEVQKDVPALSDNEAALGALMELGRFETGGPAYAQGSGEVRPVADATGEKAAVTDAADTAAPTGKAEEPMPITSTSTTEAGVEPAGPVETPVAEKAAAAERPAVSADRTAATTAEAGTGKVTPSPIEEAAPLAEKPVRNVVMVNEINKAGEVVLRPNKPTKELLQTYARTAGLLKQLRDCLEK